MAALKHYGEDGPKELSSILLMELDSRWCREGGEFAPTTEAIPMGAVLCRNEQGQYIPFGSELSAAVAASEGVEAKEAVTADKPVAILISKKMDESEEAQPCVVVRRGVCVAKNNLFWLPTVGDEQKTGALAELASLGIIAKE